MSTIPAIAATGLQERRVSNPGRENRFFLGMSIACMLGVFVGFSRTYYLKRYFGTHELPLLFHIHGMVFTAWMIYFVIQTGLIANRRVSLHRQLGYAGAALAGAMTVLGASVAYYASKYGFALPIPFTHNPEGVLFFTWLNILLFAMFVTAGFYFRRNRQAHQRLMLMAMVCELMPSALGRLPAAAHPVGLIFLFVLAGPLYDLFTLHRVHRAYLWSLSIFIITQPPIRMLVGNSATWYRMAHWLLS